MGRKAEGTSFVGTDTTRPRLSSSSSSPDGKPEVTYAGETQFRRHVKIRRNANRFDPEWQQYFAEREFQKKFGITRQQAVIKPS